MLPSPGPRRPRGDPPPAARPVVSRNLAVGSGDRTGAEGIEWSGVALGLGDAAVDPPWERRPRDRLADQDVVEDDRRPEEVEEVARRSSVVEESSPRRGAEAERAAPLQDESFFSAQPWARTYPGPGARVFVGRLGRWRLRGWRSGEELRD